ncbi:MAG: hypothetical protein H0W53_14170 [Acidobacteria bacterium]|nr:hypothetical protein [Acidobacteriota bacterium]
MEPNIAIGLLWFVAFLFSTTVHEAMHALVAWKGGDPAAYEGGQVSLSPLPPSSGSPSACCAKDTGPSLTPMQPWLSRRP